MRTKAALLVATMLLTGCGGAPFEAAPPGDEAGPSVAVHEPVPGVDAGSRPDAPTGSVEPDGAAYDVATRPDAFPAEAATALDAHSESAATVAICADGCGLPDGGCASGGWGDGWCGMNGTACYVCHNAPDGGEVCATDYHLIDGGVSSVPNGTVCVVVTGH